MLNSCSGKGEGLGTIAGIHLVKSEHEALVSIPVSCVEEVCLNQATGNKRVEDYTGLIISVSLTVDAIETEPSSVTMAA
jgi:hypothetical protein